MKHRRIIRKRDAEKLGADSSTNVSKYIVGKKKFGSFYIRIKNVNAANNNQIGKKAP